MSRIRIIKGTYTKITHGNHDIFSEGNINSYAENVINEKGEEEGVKYGTPKDPPKFELAAKCMVQFRPHNNWTGEFGFDWIRCGDTSLTGDKWYKSIVGKNRDTNGNISNSVNYGNNIVADEGEYRKLLRKFLVMKVNFIKDFYIVPWVSLFKDKTIKLSLKLHIEESPKKLVFKYDKALFKLNHEEVNQKGKGKHTLPDYLQITCIKTFNEDKFIDVLADDMLAGRLKIHRNGKVDRKKLSVILARVKLGNNIGNISGENTKLKKYLGQALITPEIKIDESVDVTSDRNFQRKFVKNGRLVYSADSAGHGELHNYMLAHYDLRSKYPDSFIIYVFNLPGVSSGFGAGGEAYGINSDNAIVFEIATRRDTCLVHELLHSLGLYHTFDNDSLFTFPKVTENIMDYTNPRYALFKWQWDIIRSHRLIKAV